MALSEDILCKVFIACPSCAHRRTVRSSTYPGYKGRTHPHSVQTTSVGSRWTPPPPQVLQTRAGCVKEKFDSAEVAATDTDGELAAIGGDTDVAGCVKEKFDSAEVAATDTD